MSQFFCHFYISLVNKLHLKNESFLPGAPGRILHTTCHCFCVFIVPNFSRFSASPPHCVPHPPCSVLLKALGQTGQAARIGTQQLFSKHALTMFSPSCPTTTQKVSGPRRCRDHPCFNERRGGFPHQAIIGRWGSDFSLGIHPSAPRKWTGAPQNSN